MGYDELLFLSGNDIPFPQAGITIHQPKIKEIAYITEEVFWPACELLKFNKEILTEQDKNGLINRSNFNIIMMMVQEKNVEAQKARNNIFQLLALLFPSYKLKLNKQNLTIQLQDVETEQIKEINESNFQAFKKILIIMFCLTNEANKEYNPKGDLAKRIADQLKKGRQRRAQLAPQTKIALLSRYVSILAIGEKKDINELMNYTVYQLIDQFKRFELKVHYDNWLKFKIAGATGMEDPDDWMKDIHENNK